MTIAPIAALGTAWIVTLVILAILIIALVIVGVWGNKQQKKSADAQQQLQDAAQPMTLLVIDKKRMKISEANLPKVVIDNVPKMMRRSKVPIVKAKVGPRIMTFMCDEKVYARRILDKYELMPYFDVVVGSEMDGQRTDKGEVITEALRQLQVADGQRQEVLMIGDRLHDMIGAGKNHVDKLGVYYGYAHEGELEEAGADYTVCTVEELYDFFKAH